MELNNNNNVIMVTIDRHPVACIAYFSHLIIYTLTVNHRVTLIH